MILKQKSTLVDVVTKILQITPKLDFYQKKFAEFKDVFEENGQLQIQNMSLQTELQTVSARNQELELILNTKDKWIEIKKQQEEQWKQIQEEEEKKR